MSSTRRTPTDGAPAAAATGPAPVPIGALPRPVLETGVVTRSEDAAPGVGLLAFRAPATANAHRPGRFVHLRTGDASTLLRRPFSIARTEGDEIILLYRIIGTGTRWMRARRRGDPLDLMGPLGNAFGLQVDAACTLLVGGGLGIAPLLGLALALQRAGQTGPIEALLGVRSAGDVFGPALTEGVEGLDWRLATDDGSEGFAGNAVELLAVRLDELARDGVPMTTLSVRVAGPEPMLRAAARLGRERGVAMQVSMEAHMACGVGACRACGIVRWTDASRINGRVCKEGPVFDAAEVDWEATT